jgi:expansin (peptidoglycan-binding protein)
MLIKVLVYLTLPILLLCGAGSEAQFALPAGGGGGPNPPNLVPGPDVIVGDLPSLEQFGSSGTQVGLALGTTSCNNGDVELNWLMMPNTDHPVIPQNLYRMSGGPGNDERFEQIGQSWLKHAFRVEQGDICGFGCVSSGTQTRLGVGCSDPYTASLNANQNSLGSRAWVNPFTGVFPSTAREHTGHAHAGTSHRLLVEGSDLNTTMNSGATYYAEGQYVTPHEYVWCQAHPGQCNMSNNVSYRRFIVAGTTSFTFSPVGSTVQMTPAIQAWPGAAINPIEPVPGADGRAFIACKVTNPSTGVWHYEYALYNQNLDRGIQSFSVPLGGGVALSNLGFHAPLNHPGFANDGTEGDAGFSNAAWAATQTSNALTWSTETFAQNPNANALRWGTLYNFRFDSDRPPQVVNATIGFFKTGAPITVGVQGPSTDGSVTPTPVPTPTPRSQAVNLSTRMGIQTGDNIAVGGFIISGSISKHVLIRALGPSLAGLGVPNAMADPMLELHGPGTFVTTANDNWRDDPIQEALIVATGIPPANDLESAIEARLVPGAYTALVKGKNNTTGIGLVEVYDLNPEVSSRLANISTRAFVSTGDNIVIAGFMLGSNSPQAGSAGVVVRGIGPSLTALGVPDALANPTLELRDSNGALLVANNDWQEDPAQAAELTAAGLAPTSQLESGLAVTLPPGLYTALLAGSNNSIGVGLVEVYDRGAP